MAYIVMAYIAMAGICERVWPAYPHACVWHTERIRGSDRGGLRCHRCAAHADRRGASAADCRRGPAAADSDGLSEQCCCGRHCRSEQCPRAMADSPANSFAGGWLQGVPDLATAISAPIQDVIPTHHAGAA